MIGISPCPMPAQYQVLVSSCCSEPFKQEKKHKKELGRRADNEGPVLRGTQQMQAAVSLLFLLKVVQSHSVKGEETVLRL